MLTALGVIVAVILYIFTVIVLGSLRPGYNHLTQYISELGEVGASNAIILNSVLILDGLLIIAFAFGLHRGISEGKRSWIGPALVAVFGVGLVGGGIFPCGPGCAPESSQTIMHNLAGFPALVAIIFAPLIISRRLKRDSRWKGYDTFSLVIGIAAIPLIIANFTVFPSIGFAGLGQRLVLVVQLGWYIVMAIGLLRISMRLGS